MESDRVDERAHQLVDSIYAAAMDPARWQDVVDQLSAIFHGSPAMFSRPLAGDALQVVRHATGLDPERAGEFLPRLMLETPWSTRFLKKFADRFAELGEQLGAIDPASLHLYKDWMEPMGLAPYWPAGHTVLDAQGRFAAGVTVFRKQGQGPFTEAELTYATQFVPHLARAIHIQQALRDSHSKRAALGEAVDRLPTGVLLLDSQRHVVLENRCARRILADDDGLRVDASGPSALDARENVRLQELIAQALDPDVDRLAAGGFTKVQRPSGRRDYALLVARLAEGDAGATRDAAVVIFVVDPESGRSTPAEVLEDLYELTHAEAEIVRLIAQGMTLEEAAAARGVSMNTARSHLKHAFAKTGTGRQSELLRLVIAGVGAIGGAGDDR